MARRALILFAALVAGLLASWLLRIRGVDNAPAAGRGATLHDAAGVDATSHELEMGEPAASAVQRDRAVQTLHAGDSTNEASSLEEAGAMLVVRAVDKASRAPVAGIRMSVYSPNLDQEFPAPNVDGSKGTLDTSPITAIEGRVEFDVPDGVDLLLAAYGDDESLGSFTEVIAALGPGERRELTVEVPAGDDLRYFGRVLAREDERPIAGATIELVDGTKSFTPTRPDGSFELSLNSWKGLELRIHAPGFGIVLVDVGTEHETLETADVVHLSRGASLHARLLDTSGASITDASIRVWTEAYLLGIAEAEDWYVPSIPESEWRTNSSTSWKTSADSFGLYVLQDLPPDLPLHVEILRGEQVVKRDLPPLSVAAGEVREVDWRIGAGCLLEGIVVDQRGEVVKSRTIWLQRAEPDERPIFSPYATTDVVGESITGTDGRFAFVDVSPGTWWVGPEARREELGVFDPEAIAPVAEVVEIVEGSARQELRLRVHRGLYIRGRVLDHAGLLVPEFGVAGFNETANLSFETKSGSDGEFALGPLVAGHYGLMAFPRTDADPRPPMASAGDEGIEVRVKFGGRVSGTVLDGATGKVCVAELTFALRGSPDRDYTTTESYVDGAFEIDGLLPGTYDVAVTASGQRVGMLSGVTVTVGSEIRNQVVTLVRGATLRLRNAGKEGSLSYRVLSGGVMIASDWIDVGGHGATAVPSGRLVIEYQLADGTSEKKEIELAVGEERELVIGGE